MRGKTDQAITLYEKAVAIGPDPALSLPTNLVATAGSTVVAPLNDEAALDVVFARHGAEIAAAIRDFVGRTAAAAA